MKTIEELNALKADLKALKEKIADIKAELLHNEITEMNAKLAELSNDELDLVTGGDAPIVSGDPRCPYDGAALVRVWGDGRGYDVFECPTCGQQFMHIWDGDRWV